MRTPGTVMASSTTALASLMERRPCTGRTTPLVSEVPHARWLVIESCTFGLGVLVSAAVAGV